jgi:hypothetical protein
MSALDGDVLPPATSEWRTPTAAESEAMAAEIVTAHGELIEGMRTTVDKAVMIGRLLRRAKDVWRGQFLYWLETKTPIKRRMAAFYMELATARQAIGGGRDWKSISTLGVAGAIAELRARRRKAARRAERQNLSVGTWPAVPVVVTPATLHEPSALVAGILGHVFVHRRKHPQCTDADILAGLFEVERLVRDGALHAGLGGRS